MDILVIWSQLKMLRKVFLNLKSFLAKFLLAKIVRGHSFSTYAKFFEKLTISYPLLTCAYHGV